MERCGFIDTYDQMKERCYFSDPAEFREKVAGEGLFSISQETGGGLYGGRFLRGGGCFRARDWRGCEASRAGGEAGARKRGAPQSPVFCRHGLRKTRPHHSGGYYRYGNARWFAGKAFWPAILLTAAVFLASCASQNASAEEYYSIGMAYYNIGKFDEAEKWLLRAQSADRTMMASEYQLGRIAFENKRFSEAAEHFEGILKKDALNVMALEAAAYTRIKMGDTERALQYYQEILAIVPENADDGYNYAILLFAAEEYAEAESVLLKYDYNLPASADAQLLLSRVQAAAEKPEAIDSYALYLAGNTDPAARYEFAQVLAKHEFYARALEEYTQTLEEVTAETETLKKANIRFEIARLRYIADSDSAAALTELQGAITDGFADIAKIAELLDDPRLSAEVKEDIRTAADAIKSAESDAATDTAAGAAADTATDTAAPTGTAGE
jgi:tetratricopeptide (TPR) repeat protein